VDLIKRNLLDQPYGFILGKPSAEFAKKLADDERQRVAAQAEALGQEKLKQLGEQLEASLAANEVQIPTEELARFPIPDTSKIPTIPISTFRNHRPPMETEDNNKLKERVCTDAGMPSFFVQLDNIPSLFISTTVLIDTTKLDDRYRPYLGLYLDALFEAPIVQESGKTLSHEEVVSQLNADTLSSYSTLGRDGRAFACGTFAQAVVLNLKSEVSKYERIVEWMKDLIFNTQFTAERLIITAQKLVNDAAQFKREGMEMVSTDIAYTNFDRIRSNHGANNVVKQHRFLTNLLEKLKNEESAKEVLADFLAFRNALCKPENIRVHVAGNIYEKLEAPLKPWANGFLPQSVQSTLELEAGVLKNLDEIQSSHAYHTAQVNKPEHGNVLSMAAIESSYLVQTFPGPTTWDDPDIPPLMVLNEYLTTMEGPFWKQLRGMGLAYSYSIRLRPEQGLLYFVLYKSVSIPKAYQQSQNIIAKFIKREVEFEETGIDAAKSSSIFSIISREETAPAAAAYSLLNYLSSAPSDTNKRMLEKIQAVSLDDLHRVLNKHLAPLFDSTQTNISITTNPSNTDEIRDFFETKLGKKVSVVTSVEEHYAA
jgi:Zn-dependent M16 (insulinase) family peptidase